MWCLIPDLCLLSYFYPLLLRYTQDLNPVIVFDTVAGEIQRFPNVKQIFKSRKDVHLNNLITPIYATLHSNDQSNRRIIVKDY